MTPAEFAAKWRDSTAKESAASQEHFIDLCRMLGTPTPNEADPTGEWYAFEKGAGKAAGGDGFADVWKRRHFAWEYKGKTKDLGAAYLQLLNYSSALENPPILVVCDLDRFEVRTNFTNTPTKLYTFDLADLAADPSEPVRILRALMTDPEELRPREAADELTGKAASHFAELAIGLRARGEDPQRVAHFLDKLLFCLYAEDAGVRADPELGSRTDPLVGRATARPATEAPTVQVWRPGDTVGTVIDTTDPEAAGHSRPGGSIRSR